MKRFLRRLLLGAVCLFFLLIRFADVRVGAGSIEYPMLRAWQMIGVTAESLTLESWSEISANINDETELSYVIEKIAEKLQLVKVRERALGRSKGLLYATVEGLKKDGTVVTLSLQGSKTSWQLGMYSIRGGKCDDLGKYLHDYRQELKLCKLGNPEILIGISGYYNGKINPKRLQDISVRAFETLDAKIIESDSTLDGCCYRGSVLKKAGLSSNFGVELTAVYDELCQQTEVSLQVIE